MLNVVRNDKYLELILIIFHSIVGLDQRTTIIRWKSISWLAQEVAILNKVSHEFDFFWFFFVLYSFPLPLRYFVDEVLFIKSLHSGMILNFGEQFNDVFCDPWAPFLYGLGCGLDGICHLLIAELWAHSMERVEGLVHQLHLRQAVLWCPRQSSMALESSPAGGLNTGSPQLKAKRLLVNNKRQSLNLSFTFLDMYPAMYSWAPSSDFVRSTLTG